MPLAFSIESRVKSWPSIAEKLQRPGLVVPALAAMQDLVGLRLILQFRRDVDKVCSIIETSFDVVRRYDTGHRLKEDQFGYASIHFVIRLKREWLAVPTLAELGDLTAEVQVRTTAQHIWAGASHLLQYKQESSVPTELRRAVYRASALLEMVDLEFERVLLEREAYRARIAESSPESDGALNVDSLEKTLDALLPQANKTSAEEYDELLRLLTKCKVTTGAHLERLWAETKGAVLANEESRVKHNRKLLAGGRSPAGTRSERAAAGVYFTHSGLVRVALRSAGKIP